MGLITLVRGFKVSVSNFDAFLEANGLPTLGGGYQPLSKEAEDIAKLFRVSGIDCKVGVFVPYVSGFNLSRYLFVCCDWIHVLAARDIEGVLQEPVPPSFEQLRDSLGAESGVSRYIVYNDDTPLAYTPQELIERNTAPIACGVCDATFSLWEDRMIHRRVKHGISEDQNPMPDC